MEPDLEKCWICEHSFSEDSLRNFMCTECFEKKHRKCYYCDDDVRVCRDDCGACNCAECLRIICDDDKCSYFIDQDYHICIDCFNTEPEKWKEEKRKFSR